METKGQGGYSVSRSLPEVVQRAQTGREMTMQRAVVTNLTAGRDLRCPWQGGVIAIFIQGGMGACQP